MRLKHIYITKEGEPMANPEMEYPNDVKEPPFQPFYKPYGMGDDEYYHEKKLAEKRLDDYYAEQQELENQYHSGLLPFEDIEKVKSLMTDSVDASHKEWQVKVICGRCCGSGVLDDEVGEAPTGYRCPICDGVGHFWNDCEHPAHYVADPEDHEYRAIFKPDTLIPVDIEVEVVMLNVPCNCTKPCEQFNDCQYRKVLCIKP